MCFFTEFGCGKSFRDRTLFIDICSEVLQLFSRTFFKEHFYECALELSSDSVPNIRLRFVLHFDLTKITRDLSLILWQWNNSALPPWVDFIRDIFCCIIPNYDSKMQVACLALSPCFEGPSRSGVFQSVMSWLTVPERNCQICRNIQFKAFLACNILLIINFLFIIEEIIGIK